MTASEDGPPRSGAGWMRRLAPLLLLVAAAAVVYWQGWHRYLSLETLTENRAALRGAIDANLPVALVVYMAVYVATVALSLPGGVYLTLAGGFLFGWFIGGLATVVAATVGATIIFLIARTSLGEPLAARAGPRLAKLRAGFQEDAMSYLLFLRLVPLFPFWLVNLAPGLLGVPLRVYVIATFIGIIPGTFAFAFAGAGLDSVLAAQRRAYEDCLASRAPGDEPCRLTFDPSAAVTPELLIAFAALGVIALLPTVVKKVRQRRQPT